LRLIDGVSAASFFERTGVPLSSIQNMLDEARSRGLLSPSATRLKATALGLDFLNDLQSVFLRT
jgi:oxygen-independent coproporphyrinogen-3 oxidase